MPTQPLKQETLATLGIDEAGRGAILGPLLLAGVIVEPHQQAQLLQWGVQDSKAFGSGLKAQLHRAKLAQKICEYCSTAWLELSAKMVDQFVLHKGLNHLEQISALKLMHFLTAPQVVLDGENIFKPVKKIMEELEGQGGLADGATIIHCVDRADQQFVSVAAASIIAKHHRDSAFQTYAQQFKTSFGQILGMGYANPQTLKFIRWHQKNQASLPGEYRQQFVYKALHQV